MAATAPLNHPVSFTMSQIDMSAVADSQRARVPLAGPSIWDHAAEGHPLEFEASEHQESFSEASHYTGRWPQGAPGAPADPEALGEGGGLLSRTLLDTASPLEPGTGRSASTAEWHRSRPWSASTTGGSELGAGSSRGGGAAAGPQRPSDGSASSAALGLSSRRLAPRRTQSVPEGTARTPEEATRQRPSSAVTKKAATAPVGAAMVAPPRRQRLSRPQSAVSLRDASRSMTKSQTCPSGSSARPLAARRLTELMHRAGVAREAP